MAQVEQRDIEQANPGMITAQPVYSEEGFLLVSAHTRLTLQSINHMKAMGIQSLKLLTADDFGTDDDFGNFDTTEENEEPVEQTPFSTEIKLARTAAEHLGSVMSAARNQIRNRTHPTLGQQLIRPRVERLFDSLQRNDRALMTLARMGIRIHESIAHALSRCMTALLHPRTTLMGREGAIELGMAALLCDLGMWSIPDEILNKPAKLDRKERQTLQAHPLATAKILQQKSYPAATIQYVIEHHERYDGGGYPRGISADQTSDGGYIVGLADAYCAMTTRRVYKGPMSPTKALAELNATRNTLFPADFVEELIKRFGLFPVGTPVELSNGESGVVNRVNTDDPLRPRVSIIFDNRGRRRSYMCQIDLSEDTDISIVRTLDPNSLGIDISTFLFVN